MTQLYSKPFEWENKNYDIVIFFEGNNLASGKYIVKPYYNGNSIGSGISQSVELTFSSMIEKGIPFLSDLITVVEYDIRRGLDTK
jgi:hypothetical protein